MKKFKITHVGRKGESVPYLIQPSQEIEAESASEACQKLGWFLSECHIEEVGMMAIWTTVKIRTIGGGEDRCAVEGITTVHGLTLGGAAWCCVEEDGSLVISTTKDCYVYHDDDSFSLWLSMEPMAQFKDAVVTPEGS